MQHLKDKPAIRRKVIATGFRTKRRGYYKSVVSAATVKVP